MYLGIDIGTSKTAAVIVDDAGRLTADASVIHSAGVSTLPGRAEQNATILLRSASEAVGGLPADCRRRVKTVGVTGQMHGVVLVDYRLMPVSNLVTWQDQRCLGDAEFLPDLCRRTGYPLRTGFGMATMAWLSARDGVPREAARMSTIHDLMAARLCALETPAIDPTDAASMGLFDISRACWDMTAVSAAGIDAALLPTVVSCGSEAGRLARSAADGLGIPEGIPVCAAIGDNQASLFATIIDPKTDVALTLGTGGQLSAVLHSPVSGIVHRPLLELRPYADGKYMIAAISLAGGGAWKKTAEFLFECRGRFGLAETNLDGIYSRMNELGLACPAPGILRVDDLPSLCSNPGRLGAGEIAGGVARWIIKDLADVFPGELLASRKRVVASGNGLRRNPLLLHMAEECLGLPTVVSELREEAACGAALLARRLCDA